jgi:hypothetical protein
MPVWHFYAFGKIVDICPSFDVRAIMSENGLLKRTKMNQNEEIVSENTEGT